MANVVPLRFDTAEVIRRVATSLRELAVADAEQTAKRIVVAARRGEECILWPEPVTMTTERAIMSGIYEGLSAAFHGLRLR